MNHVFREYDVRGIAGSDISPDFYARMGTAFGGLLARRAPGEAISCAVGRDNRTTSPEYQASFVKGLLSTGCDVVDVGQLTTPGVYFANSFLSTTGVAAVTASHNPPQYNGAKFRFKGLPVSGFEVGNAMEELMQSSPRRGALVKKDISSDYVAAIADGISLSRKLKVVVDAGNGVAGPFAVAALEKIGCEVIPLYCEPDANYPNHHPNPVDLANFPALVDAVRRNGADFGIMFDGDGDRVAAVDEKGEIVWPDMLLLLFARQLLEKQPGSRVVVEIKCSQAVVDDVTARGGVPLLCRTGYPNIEKMMAEQGSPLGAEMSGHFYFTTPGRKWLSDAIYASCRLASLVSSSDGSLSSLLSDAPEYFSSKEYRLHVGGEKAESRKFEIVDELTAGFKRHYQVTEIDGARVAFDDGWGLVRCSKTGPELTLRFEGRTQSALERIRGLFKERLAAYPEVEAGL